MIRCLKNIKNDNRQSMTWQFVDLNIAKYIEKYTAKYTGTKASVSKMTQIWLLEVS